MLEYGWHTDPLKYGPEIDPYKTSFCPPTTLKPNLRSCTWYTALSTFRSEIIFLCWCFSDKQWVKQRSRWCWSTQCGYSHFAFSQVLLSGSWLYKHKPSPTCVHSVSRMCGPALPNTQSVFSAAIRTERLLQPFAASVAAWSPVRLHLRGAGGKMNTSHLGTLN